MSISVISGALGAMLALKRTCPKCGGEQVVPKEEKNNLVSCKFCGAKIPAHMKGSPYSSERD